MCGQAAEKDAKLAEIAAQDVALDALLSEEATEEEEEAAAAEGAEPAPKRRCYYASTASCSVQYSTV